MRHYSTQELLEVNNKAPLLVQETLSSESTITVISNLGTSLKLHIDQIGLVAELNVQMLLGLIGPEEFLKELIAARVPDADAKQIMVEINQKIFVPLREKMRGGEKVTPQPVKPVAPARSVMPPRERDLTFINPTPANPRLPNRPDIRQSADIDKWIHPPQKINAPVPNYAPPQQPQKYFHLENKIPSPNMIETKVANPITDEKLLEDHEEPHIDMGEKMQDANLPMIRPPAPTVPAKTVLRPAEFRQRANVGGPPPNLPGAMPEPVAPLKPSTLPITPSAKSYSSDPYREPIDTP